ncbi:MAG: FHA domain-containing protein [Phycisphaerae bacterium]|nr:FHA domain-containing protein [Phycisphaerae bacterium]
MRLLVKRGFSLINDLHFTQGPIYIGRKPKCQVFLPDRAVSRQHAVIYTTPNGSWMIQDLESPNRTMINGRPITKIPLQEGDVVSISDFAIEVHFEPEIAFTSKDQSLDMGDTITNVQVNIPSIYQTSRNESHTIHLTAEHMQDFYRLNVALTAKTDQEELLEELTAILVNQLNAYHIWVGLRETASGPLTCYCGRTKNGSHIALEGLIGRDLIKQSIQNETYILLPCFSDYFSKGDSSATAISGIKSAMATPIVAPTGIYGIIYLDNSSDQQPYSHKDLDFLTLVSTQVAALIEHIG